MTATLAKYTPKEELWNCIIHGTGIGLSIAGLVLLAVFSSIYGDAWVIVSTIIFGVSMTVLYTASTLYHAFRLHPFCGFPLQFHGSISSHLHKHDLMVQHKDNRHLQALLRHHEVR